MNIIFFGSSNFAIPSLQALISGGYNISCVVTQPDKQKGRGMLLAGTAVNALSKDSGLKIYQPLKINTDESARLLKSLNPDLFIVISYGQILSQEILDIPKVLSLNVHASLLPEYRGAAPINWAIIKGEKTTGVTVMKMVKNLDAGPVILQKKIDISEDDTSVSLENKLSGLAAEGLLEAIAAIENRKYGLRDQDDSEASLAPKLTKQDGLINWNQSAVEIRNLTRGCLSWPGAFTYYKGKLLKIFKAVVSSRACVPSTNPGQIAQISKGGLVVACGKDNLVIKELQIEGKRSMAVEEFIIGHRIFLGDILGKK